MAAEPDAAQIRTPDPDSAEKASWPTQITRSSWSYALRRAVHEFRRDQCTDSAAVMTFFAVLSIFPGLLAVVSLLGIVGRAEETTRVILGLLADTGAPAGAVAVLEGPIRDLTAFPSASLTLVVGLLGALWTASGYVRAFGRSMNRIYEIEEGRPVWKLYPQMIGITLSLIVLVVVMVLILLLSGSVAEWFGGLVGLSGTTLRLWNAVRVPVLLALVAFMIALLYYATPNVRQPRFRWLSMGSAIAIAVMSAATAGFSFYVARFSTYNAAYGTIGGVVVLLLWIWIINIVLLAGAEFNAETERARQLQAGLAAEEVLRLPPRDAGGIRKVEDKDRELIEEGRELRRRHASRRGADEPAGGSHRAGGAA